MNWIQSILYGFTMGFSEFIPVSSSAQSQILQLLFGVSNHDPVRDVLVHIFSLLAFLIAWKNPLEMFLYHAQVTRHRSGKRNRNFRDNTDARLVRGCTLPMLLAMFLIMYFSTDATLMSTALILIVNGIIIFLPERMLQGNKSSGGMSVLDSWVIGIASALSVIPGFSRMGLGISVAQMRGAGRKHALNWIYMLSVPALVLLICADIAGLTFGAQKIVLSTGFLGYLLITVSSFAGSYLAVYFMRNIILNRGLNTFAYYSWGAALFIFILYLL